MFLKMLYLYFSLLSFFKFLVFLVIQVDFDFDFDFKTVIENLNLKNQIFEQIVS